MPMKTNQKSGSQPTYNSLLMLLLVALLGGIMISCAANGNENNPLEQDAEKAEKGQGDETEATPGDPKTYPIQGVDVSHYQGTIDWPTVRSAGMQFAYIKASGGVSYQDPSFKTNWDGAKAAGLTRGAYHFYYTEDDPAQQAENFINTVGTLQAGDLVPVLDLEQGGYNSKISNADFQAGVMLWCQKVEEAMGVTPMIYSDLSFSDVHLNNPEFLKYPFWLAEYRLSSPTLPAPWKDDNWKFWQYSGSGTVKGIPNAVDLDCYRGDPSELENLIKK